MSSLYTILTICATATAVAGLFLSWRWSAVPAWLALVPMYFIANHPLSGSTLLFWGGVCAIAVGLNTLLPTAVVYSRIGVPYMAAGALAGAFTGMIMPQHQSGMIFGAVAGLMLGAIAFSRTPAGADRNMVFPSRLWFNYTCAKGLPIVAAVATAAIAIMAVIRIYSPSILS